MTEHEGASLLSEVLEEPLRILLVEDSAADADLLVAMLEDELPAAHVLVCATVAEALPLLEGPLGIAIAITDLSLPDAEGLQALTAILRARPDIAVVVLTGRQDRDLALRALSEGAEDYLVKGTHDARAMATAVLFAAQRRAAEARAHRYERLALSLLDAMEASTCAVDGQGRIIAVNQAWRDFSAANDGDPERTGIGMDYLAVCDLAGGQAAEVAERVSAGLRGLLDGTATRFEQDYTCHSPDEQRWLSVRGNALPESGAVLSHVDLSAAKRSELALSHLSLHDPLTGLPNRELLMDRLTQALVRADGEGLVAVAFLDVDGFKRFNDSLGHPAGDELLRHVACRLLKILRPTDTLARFSGDEFVVVWAAVEAPGQVVELARQLADALAAPVELGGTTVQVTASIGVAVGRPPQTADDLLLSADAAMFDAKSSGPGRIRVYSEELRVGAAERLRTEHDLREALERQEFVLHYQPVVNLASRTIQGVEALVRWQHPLGMRMPDSFIPAAEVSGMIVRLGTWVLDEACRQGAAWAAQGLDLHIAVNFSARQIGHPDAVKSIERALRQSGLRPDRLIVEVTESSFLDDEEGALTTFTKIKGLGAAVAIDDFGTGYSSLLYLRRYPISVLKVDRQFVAGLGKTADDDAIVASVVSLARAVRAVCVAEGVETMEQYAVLADLDCDLGQGYLFSRPVPADELPNALRHARAVLQQPLPSPRARLSAAEPELPEAVLTRINALHGRGASLHTIAAALNQEGQENPSGMRWSGASVAKVVAGIPRPR